MEEPLDEAVNTTPLRLQLGGEVFHDCRGVVDTFAEYHGAWVELVKKMLPWENLPMLKNQEIYRMPSILSIRAVLDRHKEQMEGNSEFFPSVDPWFGYYVVNPDDDLPRFHNTFQKYLNLSTLKGKINFISTVTEIVTGLENHEIFYYLGHGSGKKFIEDYKIQRLKKCPAVLLMGCSSDFLNLQRSYALVGTPLSYLMAGSPIIVANLWAMLESELNLLAKALCEDLLELNDQNDGKMIGTFVSQTCEKRVRQFISEASMVCYGLLVGIHKKEEENLGSERQETC